jgi:tetratricopeptide (TPR) repeat protein
MIRFKKPPSVPWTVLSPIALVVTMNVWSIAAQGGDVSPTYADDIAPLIALHCASCHRPGGGAPFSLLTYDEVRPRASQIADVVKKRLMPPWLPERGYGLFKAERRLSDGEVATVEQWARSDARRGESAAPAATASPGEWTLGTPDLIVTVPPFDVPPNGPETFRNFSILVPITSRRYVRAVEFRPGATQTIHHARVLLDETGASGRVVERDPSSGYVGMLEDEAHFPEGHFVGWTPGKEASQVPDGMAWALEPDTRLVAQLHLRPTGVVEHVQARIGLYFTDNAPTRTPSMIRLGSKAIDIPPGAGAYTISDVYVLPVDVSVYAVMPHAHYLAREVKAYAELPDKRMVWLLYIKAWDFDWQEDYQYEQPIALPKNSTIIVQYTYDNSDGNRRNPFRPSRRVTYGPNATDEMCDLLLQVATNSNADTARVRDEFRARELSQSIEGVETRLRTNVNDVDLLQDAAALYLQAGRTDDARLFMERALALAPESAMAHYNLGTIFADQGQSTEARAQFERAVTLSPDLVDAQYALGTLLFRERRFDEAIAHLRRALDLNPLLAEAHNNLGSVYHAAGNVNEALAEYRQALKIAPRSAEAHNNIGGILQSLGNLDEAIAHFRLAVEINSDYTEAVYNLGEALARAGNRADAITYLRSAVEQRPEWPQALSTLADALLGGGDPAGVGEAARLAEQAAKLTEGENPWVLSTWAAAVAAGGDPARALRIVHDAMALAAGTSDQELISRLRRQLDSFATAPSQRTPQR